MRELSSIVAALVVAAALGSCNEVEEAAPDAGPAAGDGASVEPDVAGAEDAAAGPDAGPAQPPSSPTCVVGLDDPAVVAEIEGLHAYLGTRLVDPEDPTSPPLVVSGFVVGVASPTLGFQVQAFGTTTPGGATDLAEDAIFDIGSVQKNFRWTLLLRLAELGHLDLDDTVGSLLDRPDLAGVTFRQLMMHVSGLKHWDDTGFALDVFTQGLDHEYGFAEMMGYLDGSGGALMTGFPGAPYHYSNFGPLIAGEAAAALLDDPAVTARSLTRDLLLTPLGLTHTSFQAFEPAPAGLVPGFWADGQPHDWVAEPADAMAISSAAGAALFSNACDLLHYAQGLLVDGSLLSQATLDDAWSESAVVHDVGPPPDHHVTPIGATRGGFVTYDDPSLATWGHWGHVGSSQHGHSSAFMHSLEDDATLVVLANVEAESFDNDPFTLEKRWGATYLVQFVMMGPLRQMVINAD